MFCDSTYKIKGIIKGNFRDFKKKRIRDKERESAKNYQNYFILKKEKCKKY